MNDKTRFFENCFAVFQGGGCRGAAYVGAYRAAMSRGVHFSEVAGASAGSIVAALLGAGATADQLEAIVRELDFPSLLSPPRGPSHSKLLSTVRWITGATPLGKYVRILSHLGMHSTLRLYEWMNRKLHELRPDLPADKKILFKHLRTPTWLVATDLHDGRVKVWSNTLTPDDDVAAAVCASSSIPLYFQAFNNQYVDGGLLSNLPSFVFSRPEHVPSRRFGRILAFTLKSDKAFETTELTSLKQFINALVDATVEGAKDLQSSIQGGVYPIVIPTGSVGATDFEEMSPEKIDILMENGRKAVEQFLSNELAIVSQGRKHAAELDEDWSLLALADYLGREDLEVVIAQESLEWVRTVFPELLWWRQRGVPVRVAVPPTSQRSEREQFYLDMLAAIGVETVQAKLPFECYLLRSKDPSASLVLVRRTGEQPGLMADYYGHSDPLAVEALQARILSLFPPHPPHPPRMPLALHAAPEHVHALEEQLHQTAQYAYQDVSVHLERVKVSSLRALRAHISFAEFVQAHCLSDLYAEGRIEPFLPSEVDGALRPCWLTPPVVEQSGEGFILTQGLPRAIFCRDRGVPEIHVLVVTKVNEQLPLAPIPLGDVRILHSTYPKPHPSREELHHTRHPQGVFRLLTL